MFDLLLIDMAGVMDEAHTPAVLKIIRDRLRLPRVNLDVVCEEFFERTAPGRVDPVEVERALNEVEEYIWEGWQGDFELGDFLILLVIDQGTPGAFLMQVLHEIMQRTTLLPVVLALAVGETEEEGVILIERADLPLVWRGLPGDPVVLNTDVWLDGEAQAPLDCPALPRGSVLTVVERAAFDGDRVNRDYLLAATALEGQDTPIVVALPWLLVTHPSEWVSDPARREAGRAVATFHLPCWYSVRVEEHDRVNATTRAESERSA